MTAKAARPTEADLDGLSEEELSCMEVLDLTERPEGGRNNTFGYFDKLLALFKARELAPVEEPEEEETPERVLRKWAAANGKRVLDLRKRNRKQRHPFRHHCVVRNNQVISVHKNKVLDTDEDWGIWGWFGGGENMPKRGRVRGKLKPTKTSTTVIHTMAVHASGPRCIGMPVQNAIDKNGDIILCQSIFARMWHAHAANGFSDGIEISGKGENTIEDHQIGSAQALLRYIIASKRRNLALVGSERQLYVMPHAFSHWSRKNDCGRKIWEVMGEYGMKELGLQLGPVVGSGTIPKWVSG